MSEIQFAPRFLKQAKGMPGHVKDLLKMQVRRLHEDSNDPRLHIKQLQGKLGGLYSFRVTRNYRVIFKIAKEQIYILLAVDDRKDIYRL